MSERDASTSRETARSRGAHAPDRDPRDIVTEYAFRVDRDLPGRIVDLVVALAGTVVIRTCGSGKRYGRKA